MIRVLFVTIKSRLTHTSMVLWYTIVPFTQYDALK